MPKWLSGASWLLVQPWILSEEPEMVKEHLLCQSLTADASRRILMRGSRSTSAPFLPHSSSNNSYGQKKKKYK